MKIIVVENLEYKVCPEFCNGCIVLSKGCIIMLFPSFFQKSAALGSIREMKYMKEVGKWSQQEIEFCSLKNYDLTYTFYSKFPSWGLIGARLLHRKVQSLHNLKLCDYFLSIRSNSRFLRHVNLKTLFTLCFFLFILSSQSSGSFDLVFAWWQYKIS